MTDPMLGRAGERIAARYCLKRHLGSGAHGEVWEAFDEVAKRPVAVKLLRSGRADWLARLQLEATALRHRFPGVVALLDDGLDDGDGHDGDGHDGDDRDAKRAFVVMELIDGAPFPGRPVPCRWADMADLVMKLVETLSFIHAAFFVHRDLKPANVLVTREGDLKILDFGLVHVAAEGPERITDEQQMELLGTPAYASPEQIRGESTERSDLYALGVMVYEALSGRLPYDGTNLQQILYLKLQRPSKPLLDVAPEAPPVVARVIDSLLAIDPAARPASAAEVLRMLRGDTPNESPFPWLGPRAPLTALVEAARAGRSMDVIGPPGSGRTRCLLALAQVLEQNDERNVIMLPPGERAFSSLKPIVGSLARRSEASLAEITKLVDQRLRAELAAGLVILADDIELIDRCSAASLDRCRNAGTVVRALSSDSFPAAPRPDRVVLEPIREEDLRSLFQGPDRLLHLREDAAAALHRRTDGAPARVVAEIDTWLRLGKARWSRNLIVVSREMLEEPDLELVSTDPASDDHDDLPDTLADTLAWAALAWPHTSPELLAKMMGEPHYCVEADIDELLSRGLLRRTADGSVAPRLPVAVRGRWSEERLRAAHLAIARALPPAAARRLDHLLFAADASRAALLEIGEEAAALAENLIDEGRPSRAVSKIDSAIRCLRTLGPEARALRLRLFELWVEAAIEEKTPYALDRVIFALCREPPDPALEQLEALARAAHAQDYTNRPHSLANAVEPFVSPRLSRVRNAVRVNAARRVPDDRVEEALLEEIEASADSADRRLRDGLDTWWGRLRYRQGRFREAAELHLRVAERTDLMLDRIHSLVWAAWSLMDAFALEEAASRARAAADLAMRHRHVYFELLATCIERTVAYRLDRAGAPDIELVEALPFVGTRQLEGLIVLNEAAIAWRCGETTLARKLAERCFPMFAYVGEPGSTLVTRCFRILLGEPAADEEIDELCERAKSPLLPGLGLQALALLAMAGRLPRGAVDDALLDGLLAAIPAESRASRMDILSADEAAEAIRRARAQ